jgi:hypothetical protein
MTATALWLGAWLRGTAGSDDLLEALAQAAPDAPAVGSVLGTSPSPLPDLLRAVRASGADSTWLLLPRPGNTIGWPLGVGGEPTPAVLLSRGDVVVGLLRHEPTGWRWDRVDHLPIGVLQADMLTSGSAARALAEVVTDAAARLEVLGVQRAATRPAPRVWESAMGWLPPSLDPQAQALLVRLAALHDALDLARVEEGAAVTAAEARARAAELQQVLGRVEDLVASVVGGLNAPSRATVDPGARSTAAVERHA